MSYDLCVKVKVADLEDKYVDIAYPEYDHPTYNLGQMFRACMDWDYEQSKIYCCADIIGKIEHGIKELRDPKNRAKYRKLESDNGWGTMSTAIRDLESLWICINKTATDNELPLANLFMSW